MRITERRKFSSVLMTVVFTVFLLACSLMFYHCGSSEKEVLTSGNTLRIGINKFPMCLNPIYTVDEYSQAVVNKVFEALFRFDYAGNIENGLIESYVVVNNEVEKPKESKPEVKKKVSSTKAESKNKKENKKKSEIIITIKKNVFFDDGKELEAADVAATYRIVKDIDFFSPYYALLQFVDTIEILDKYKLKLNLNYLPANWQQQLTVKILNSKQLAKSTPDNLRGMTLSGTGPYRFAEIRVPSKIILQINPLNKTSNMYDFIEYEIVSSTHLGPLKLLKDEIDVCELQPENVDAYRNIKDWQKAFKIVPYKKFGYTYVVFNLRNPNITLNVRKIFYNILVYSDFTKTFLAGKGEPVVTPFIYLKTEVEKRKFSVQPLEKKCHIRILSNSASKLRKEFILFLRKELEAFNIILDMDFYEYNTFLAELRGGKYDIAVSAFVLDMDYDLSYILSSGGVVNYSNFSCLEMDRFLLKGLKELDNNKRERIYQGAHQVWLDELPMIPVFSLYYNMGISKNIKVPMKVKTIMGAEEDFFSNIRDWKVN